MSGIADPLEKNTATPPKLLDQVRDQLRLKHYSLRTEQAYVGWIRRYIIFHGKRHPAEMGKSELEAFLTSLAVQRNVSVSTQAQALSALLFLYRDVLGLECLRLRMKDVEFTRREIVVREGKGNKDRVTMLPDSLADRLRAQMEFVKGQHVQDLAVNRGEVWLPDALAKKYPNAPKALAWQYVFPAAGFSVDPRSGVVRGHHVDEKRVQRAVKRAAERAELVKLVSPHILRHSFAGSRL